MNLVGFVAATLCLLLLALSAYRQGQRASTSFPETTAAVVAAILSLLVFCGFVVYLVPQVVGAARDGYFGLVAGATVGSVVTNFVTLGWVLGRKHKRIRGRPGEGPELRNGSPNAPTWFNVLAHRVGRMLVAGILGVVAATLLSHKTISDATELVAGWAIATAFIYVAGVARLTFEKRIARRRADQPD